MGSVFQSYVQNVFSMGGNKLLWEGAPLAYVVLLLVGEGREFKKVDIRKVNLKSEGGCMRKSNEM